MRCWTGPGAAARRASASGCCSRRALLGIANAGAPGLLLLDEATSGLDLAGRELLLDLVDRSAVLTDLDVRATLVVAHHLEDLPVSTSHALLLAGGRVVAEGPADDVLGSTALAEAFGIPVVGRRRADGRFAVVGTGG